MKNRVRCTFSYSKRPRIHRNRHTRPPTLPNILSITSDAIVDHLRRRRGDFNATIAVSLRRTVLHRTEEISIPTTHASIGTLRCNVPCA